MQSSRRSEDDKGVLLPFSNGKVSMYHPMSGKTFNGESINDVLDQIRRQNESICRQNGTTLMVSTGCSFFTQSQYERDNLDRYKSSLFDHK